MTLAVAFANFRPVEAGEKLGVLPLGPRSNTGQKVEGGALVDYLTVVIPSGQIERAGLTDLRSLLKFVFGVNGELITTAIRDKRWQFYKQSAVVLDREGEMCGRIGLDGNGDTWCISLSGAGTRWVKSWERARAALHMLQAKISRVDLAFDDYEGESINVHEMRQLAFDGMFAEGGRPPSHRFLSDEGNGTGSTLYVGGKGHKELCIYEKGKQLGDPNSRWTRVEARLYGKHVELPLEVLTNPRAFLLGAYSVLERFIYGVCSRLRTIKKAVEVSGEAMVTWARRQVGPTLNLLRDVLGSEWAGFLEERVVREGAPGRFRGVAKGARLIELLRSELQCQS